VAVVVTDPVSVHPALYSGEERLWRWLGRREAQEGLEGPSRGGHFRPLLALRVGPASEQEREYVGEMAQAVQDATGESAELA
jgi:hypothetical protein